MNYIKKKRLKKSTKDLIVFYYTTLDMTNIDDSKKNYMYQEFIQKLRKVDHSMPKHFSINLCKCYDIWNGDVIGEKTWQM